MMPLFLGCLSGSREGFWGNNAVNGALYGAAHRRKPGGATAAAASVQTCAADVKYIEGYNAEVNKIGPFLIRSVCFWSD